MRLPILHFTVILTIGAYAATAQTLEDARKDAMQPMDADHSLTLLVRTLDARDDPALQAHLLQGMLKGLEGQRDVPAPQGWSRLSARLAASQSKDVRRMSRELGQIFGDEDATRIALATVADLTADLPARQTALATLVMQRRPELAALLQTLLTEEPLRLDAIRAYAARSLAAILGERYTESFGSTALVGDKEAQLARYKKLLTPAAIATANASRGRTVFQKTCMACHLMFGEGGDIGPDLIVENRANDWMNEFGYWSRITVVSE